MENNVSKTWERTCLEILPYYSTLCSFPSFLYVLFVQNIQDCQSDRVVITDEATGEFIQALSIFLFWNCFVRITSKMLLTCVWFTTRSMVFYLNIFRYDMINRRQLFYNSSFRTSVAWTKLNLPLFVNIYNFSGLLVWQITHSSQSKEALRLFALVGASFNGILNWHFPEILHNRSGIVHN